MHSALKNRSDGVVVQLRRKRDNQRSEERVPVKWRGRLHVGDAGDLLNCTILDFANEGARVRLDEAAELSTPIMLRVIKNGEMLRAHLVWTRGLEAGLSFT